MFFACFIHFYHIIILTKIKLVIRGLRQKVIVLKFIPYINVIFSDKINNNKRIYLLQNIIRINICCYGFYQHIQRVIVYRKLYCNILLFCAL